MDTSLIILLINLLLYIYFISETIEYRESLFAFIQLGLCFPLTILMANFVFSNNIILGYIIVIIIPLLSTAILINNILYVKGEKEKNKKFRQ